METSQPHIIYHTHKYKPPSKDACQHCGMGELEHYTECENCKAVWNGDIDHRCLQNSKT